MYDWHKLSWKEFEKELKKSKVNISELKENGMRDLIGL